MNKTHLKYMIQKNLAATNCLRYKAAPINSLIMNVVKEQTKKQILVLVGLSPSQTPSSKTYIAFKFLIAKAITHVSPQENSFYPFLRTFAARTFQY